MTRRVRPSRVVIILPPSHLLSRIRSDKQPFPPSDLAPAASPILATYAIESQARRSTVRTQQYIHLRSKSNVNTNGTSPSPENPRTDPEPRRPTYCTSMHSNYFLARVSAQQRALGPEVNIYSGIKIKSSRHTREHDARMRYCSALPRHRTRAPRESHLPTCNSSASGRSVRGRRMGGPGAHTPYIRQI